MDSLHCTLYSSLPPHARNFVILPLSNIVFHLGSRLIQLETNIALGQYWIPILFHTLHPIITENFIQKHPHSKIEFLYVETSCWCNKCKRCYARSKILELAHKYSWSVFCKIAHNSTILSFLWSFACN